MRNRFRRPWTVVVLAAGLAWACAEEPPSGPGESLGVLAAKGGKHGGGKEGPTVDGAEPNSAPQDTTLDVHVYGSGYDETSEVTFLLNGAPTPAVTTNVTRFVSDAELVANITISADALPGDYDIQATSRRGKGVGIELFEVTGEVLEITFRDDSADGLRSDGMVNLSYCDPEVSCYEEGHDFVGAHFSGANGNLMFWLEQYGSPTIRRVEVLGEFLVTRRIYTNDNQDNQGVSVPDLRGMADGTITTRMIVERGDGKGHYRYGVNCSGNSFERDDENAIRAERIQVTRVGNTWTLEGWGARHCVVSGKGRKTTIAETPVLMPFRMTVVAIR